MSKFALNIKLYFLNHKTEFALLAAFAVASAALSMFHEPWRDEAQAWLYVRDQSLPDILGNLHIEGHPALWFLMLFPLAKLGLPYESMFVLHYALAMTCGALLLFKSPFKRAVKALLLFSYLIGFAYTVVARNYVLIELLLFLIAVVFPRRYGRHALLYGFLLALLANTHIYGALAALAILAYDFFFMLGRDEAGKVRFHTHIRQIATVALTVMIGFALLYITMSGPRYASMANPRIGTLLSTDLLAITERVLGYSFGSDNTSTLEILHQLSVTNPLPIFLLKFIDLNVIAVLALIVILSKFKTAFISALFLLPFSALLVFSTNIAYRHVAVFALVALFAFWIAETTKSEFAAASVKWEEVTAQIRPAGIPVFKAATAAILVFGLLSYAVMASQEIGYPYSGSKELARFLQKNGYDTGETVLVTSSPAEVSPALPYLSNIKFMSVPGLSDSISFLRWDQNYYDFKQKDPKPFEYAAELHTRKGVKALVVLTQRPDAVPPGFVCVFDGLAEKVIKGEKYIVYMQPD